MGQCVGCWTAVHGHCKTTFLLYHSPFLFFASFRFLGRIWPLGAIWVSFPMFLGIFFCHFWPSLSQFLRQFWLFDDVFLLVFPFLGQFRFQPFFYPFMLLLINYCQFLAIFGRLLNTFGCSPLGDCWTMSQKKKQGQKWWTVVKNDPKSQYVAKCSKNGLNGPKSTTNGQKMTKKSKKWLTII